MLKKEYYKDTSLKRVGWTERSNIKRWFKIRSSAIPSEASKATIQPKQ